MKSSATIGVRLARLCSALAVAASALSGIDYAPKRNSLRRPATRIRMLPWTAPKSRVAGTS